MQDQACAGSMLGKEVFSGGGYKAVLFSACSLVLSVLHRIHSFSCQTLSYYFVALLFFVSQFSYYNISTRTNKSFVSFGHPGLHPLCPIPPVSCLKPVASLDYCTRRFDNVPYKKLKDTVIRNYP